MSLDHEQLADLLAELKGLGDNVRDGFAQARADVALVSREVSVLQGRIGAVEQRHTELDAWRKSNSDRARKLSDSDLATEAKLASEISDRKSLEERVVLIDRKQDAQLAILSSVQTLVKDPLVRKVASLVYRTIVLALLGWLGAKGLLR